MDAKKGWLWLGQVISGVLLVLLLGLHWIAQHYLVSGGMRTYSEVMAYLKNPLVLLLELSFLVVVTYHALAGVFAILLDFGPGKRLAQVIKLALIILGTATVLYGTWLVADILAY